VSDNFLLSVQKIGDVQGLKTYTIVMTYI